MLFSQCILYVIMSWYLSEIGNAKKQNHPWFCSPGSWNGVECWVGEIVNYIGKWKMANGSRINAEKDGRKTKNALIIIMHSLSQKMKNIEREREMMSWAVVKRHTLISWSWNHFFLSKLLTINPLKKAATLIVSVRVQTQIMMLTYIYTYIVFQHEKRSNFLAHFLLFLRFVPFPNPTTTSLPPQPVSAAPSPSRPPHTTLPPTSLLWSVIFLKKIKLILFDFLTHHHILWLPFGCFYLIYIYL